MSAQCNNSDEYAVQHSTEKLKSMTKEVLDIGDGTEKNKLEELKVEFEPLIELMKEVPSDTVEFTKVDVT